METWQKICEDWLGWSIEKVKVFGAEKAQAAAKAKPASSSDGREAAFVPREYRPKKPEVRVAGLVAEIKETMTKKGTRMAFVQLEDLTGRIEVIFFADAFAQYGDLLRRAMAEVEPVVCLGELDALEEGSKILARALEPVEEAHKNRVQQVVLKIPLEKARPEQLRSLKVKLNHFRGRCPVRIIFDGPRYRTHLELPKTVKVQPSTEMVEAVNQVFGTSVVTLQ
jgi:DNA polymerase-3 subunit alpha